jgi:hypothetical protein
VFAAAKKLEVHAWLANQQDWHLVVQDMDASICFCVVLHGFFHFHGR